MTLNRNIENYHTESEQVAFNPANVVPGIDFSNDPVLQGRLIAYHSAQLYRIGPNFQELPINKPVCPFHNNQRRGPMRTRIDVVHVNYHNNSLADNTPHETPIEEGGYEHFPKEVGGHTTRAHVDSVNDFYSQTRIFWNSLTPIEKMHTIEAFSYQLGNVVDESVRQQNVNLLANVDVELASTVADNIGVARPTGSHVPVSESYASLSQYHTPPSAYTKKVGVLIGDGFTDQEVLEVLEFFDQQKVFYDIISERLGYVTGANGTKIKVGKTFLTSGPYLVDSVYVVGGNSSNQKRFTQNVLEFMNMAYKLYKPIGIALTGQAMIQGPGMENLEGVVIAGNSDNFKLDFVAAIAQSRFWNRDDGTGPASLGMTGITK